MIFNRAFDVYLSSNKNLINGGVWGNRTHSDRKVLVLQTSVSTLAR